GTGVINLNSGTFNHTAGELRVGASNTNGAFSGGSGTVNLFGGTMTLGALTVARPNDATGLINGTVNVTGGTLTSTGDAIVAWRGNGTGTLNLNSGTVNVGTTVTKWLRIGDLDTVKGVVNVNGGNLNL